MTRLVAVLGFLGVLSCAPTESPVDVAARREAALATVGLRQPQLARQYLAAAACPAGTVCSLADDNGDGQADLVRRDGSGQVTIALANGWGYGPFLPFASGCEKDTLCFVADVDGVRGAELITARADGSVLLRRFAGGQELAAPVVLVDKGFCTGRAPRCALVQADADQQPELAWLDDSGSLLTVDTLGKGVSKAVSTACKDLRCLFAEVDGVPGAELIAWGPATKGTIHVESLASGQQDSLPIDCEKTACTIADADGDGRVDVLQSSKGAGVWLLSSMSWKVPLSVDAAAVCADTERCLWADGNGDGFDDLYRIDLLGNVSFHPALDARGRLEAATLELSLLATAQARSQIAEVEAGERAVVSLFAPARAEPPYVAGATALPDDAYLARFAELQAQVDALASELFAAIPGEADTVTDADVRAARELAMFVAVARTVKDAVPLGVSRRGEGCADVVLHEKSIADGVERRSASALFRFARAMTLSENRQRVEELVGVLSQLTAGFRCLNQDELVILDAAYSDAVLQTAADLSAAGRPSAARWLIDSALPVTLLTFDAAKYSTVPPSYRLLTARVGTSVIPGVMPEAGFDFAAAGADAACQTFLCQIYRNPRRDLGERGLMIDRLGLWLPDPLASGRLRELTLEPDDLFEHLRDLRDLGEGDCSLFEVAGFGFRCPSRDTCRSSSLAEDPLAAFADPLGIATAPPGPGGLGSPLTHLMTPRGTGLEERNGCRSGSGSSGGGGAGVGACMGPPLGSRRGRFSADPELDRMMRCALETASAPVDVDLDIGRGCLVGQDAPAEAPPERPTVAELWRQYPGIRDQVVRMLREGGDIDVGDFHYSRDELVAGIRDSFPGAGRMTEERITELLATDVADAVEDARPGDTGADHDLGVTDGALNNPDITVDVGEHGGMDDPLGELARTLVHEGVHVLLMESEARGWVRTGGGAEERDHRITRRIGLGGLCGDASDCASGCGAGDAFAKRFAQCVEPTGPVDLRDVQCDMAIDLCVNRGTGEMQWPLADSCVPSASLAPEPDCLVVNCADGAMASRCCGAVGPAGSVPIFDIDIGPGPMPPRPTLDLAFDDWLEAISR